MSTTQLQTPEIELDRIHVVDGFNARRHFDQRGPDLVTEDFFFSFVGEAEFGRKVGVRSGPEVRRFHLEAARYDFEWSARRCLCAGCEDGGQQQGAESRERQTGRTGRGKAICQSVERSHLELLLVHGGVESGSRHGPGLHF